MHAHVHREHPWFSAPKGVGRRTNTPLEAWQTRARRARPPQSRRRRARRRGRRDQGALGASGGRWDGRGGREARARARPHHAAASACQSSCARGRARQFRGRHGPPTAASVPLALGTSTTSRRGCEERVLAWRERAARALMICSCGESLYGPELRRVISPQKVGDLSIPTPGPRRGRAGSRSPASLELTAAVGKAWRARRSWDIPAACLQ